MSWLLAAFKGLAAIPEIIKELKELNGYFRKQHKLKLMELAINARADLKRAKTEEDVWSALEQVTKVQRG